MNRKIKEIDQLKKLALESRKDVLKMVRIAGEGHLGAAFSCMEVMISLYFNILNIDRFIKTCLERSRSFYYEQRSWLFCSICSIEQGVFFFQLTYYILSKTKIQSLADTRIETKFLALTCQLGL